MEKKILIADAHCDTISRIHNTGEFLYKNSGHFDLERAKENNYALQIFAVWVNPKEESPLKKAQDMIMTYHEECAKNLDNVSKIRSKWDFETGKIGTVLAIEGGNILEGNIENIKIIYDMGVRLMTLTWNGINALGSGAISENPQGLTPFGIEVLHKMEQLGMFIDVSHLCEKGFWDVIKHTKAETPLFASHSNCQAICAHPRNLTDEQIRAIIKRKGFMGLNLYTPFLGGNNLSQINKHIKHIIALGGEDVIGFGCDFDGADELPKGINGIENIDKIIKRIKNTFGMEITEKICGKNLLKFFS